MKNNDQEIHHPKIYKFKKAKTEKELSCWIKSRKIMLGLNDKKLMGITIELKYKGPSLILKYKNQKIISAVLDNNKNFIEKISDITGIPSKLPDKTPKEIEITGNIIKDINNNNIFIAHGYNFTSSPLCESWHYLNYLFEEWGFGNKNLIEINQISWNSNATIEEINKIIEKIKEIKDGFPCNINSIVIKIDSEKSRNKLKYKLNYTDFYPRWAISYKI